MKHVFRGDADTAAPASFPDYRASPCRSNQNLVGFGLASSDLALVAAYHSRWRRVVGARLAHFLGMSPGVRNQAKGAGMKRVPNRGARTPLAICVASGMVRMWTTKSAHVTFFSPTSPRDDLPYPSLSASRRTYPAGSSTWRRVWPLSFHHRTTTGPSGVRSLPSHQSRPTSAIFRRTVLFCVST